ncbi:MAG: terminase small subunit [Armatimonadetes bacterium]|nr:terminase small subunit [Armatimonadota bacterium]
MPTATLNERQAAFTRHYADCLNATMAAVRAGYSKKTAYSIGHENLKKPEIAAVIKRLLEAQAMPREEVAARLAMQARANMSDFLIEVEVPDGKDESGNPRTRRMVVPDLLAAKKAGSLGLIKKVKYGRDGLSFELYDAQAALTTLAKITGLLDGGASDPDMEAEPETGDEINVTAEQLETQAALEKAAGHG